MAEKPSTPFEEVEVEHNGVTSTMSLMVYALRSMREEIIKDACRLLKIEELTQEQLEGLYTITCEICQLRNIMRSHLPKQNFSASHFFIHNKFKKNSN